MHESVSLLASRLGRRRKPPVGAIFEKPRVLLIRAVIWMAHRNPLSDDNQQMGTDCGNAKGRAATMVAARCDSFEFESRKSVYGA
jgi:hypothetical protein